MRARSAARNSAGGVLPRQTHAWRHRRCRVRLRYASAGVALDAEHLQARVGQPGGRPAAADHVEPLGLHVGHVRHRQRLALARRRSPAIAAIGGGQHHGGRGARRAARRARPGSRAARAGRGRARGARARAAGVAQAGAVEPGRGVQPDRVAAARRVGEHRRGGGGDDDRARRVPLDRGAHGAPRRDRLDEVVHRVAAAQAHRPRRSRTDAAATRRARRAQLLQRTARRPRASPAWCRARAAACRRAALTAATASSARGSRRPSPSPSKRSRWRARAALAQLARPLGSRRQLARARAGRAGVAGGHHQPGLPCTTASRAAAHVGGHHRPPERHRLEDAHRQRLGLAEQADRVAARRSGRARRARDPSSATPARPRAEPLERARARRRRRPRSPRSRGACAPGRGQTASTNASTPLLRAQVAPRTARRARRRQPSSRRVASRSRVHGDAGLEHAVRRPPRCARGGSRAAPSGSTWRSVTAITRSTRGATRRVSARWCGRAGSSSPVGGERGVLVVARAARAARRAIASPTSWALTPRVTTAPGRGRQPRPARGAGRAASARRRSPQARRRHAGVDAGPRRAGPRR